MTREKYEAILEQFKKVYTGGNAKTPFVELDALAIAVSLKTPKRIEKFSKMSAKEQSELVPLYSSGHSGSSWNYTVGRAKMYAEEGNLEKLPGYDIVCQALESERETSPKMAYGKKQGGLLGAWQKVKEKFDELDKAVDRKMDQVTFGLWTGRLFVDGFKKLMRRDSKAHGQTPDKDTKPKMTGKKYEEILDQFKKVYTGGNAKTPFVELDALAIAVSLKTPERIEKFSKMSAKEQSELVPLYSSGHSGISWSYTVGRAKMYAEEGNLEKLPGYDIVCQALESKRETSPKMAYGKKQGGLLETLRKAQEKFDELDKAVDRKMDQVTFGLWTGRPFINGLKRWTGRD